MRMAMAGRLLAKLGTSFGNPTIGEIKGSLICNVYVYLIVACLWMYPVPSLGRRGSVRFVGTLANYSGDVVLGGLFPVHGYNHESKVCGTIQDQDGIQLMEAMMFSLDEINSSGFLPGFTLGALIADTCDSATVALERSVEFVRDLTETLTFPGQLPLQCSDGSKPRRTGTGNLDRVVGVVGAAASSISTQVASFLRLFKVPQVSYLSTTPDLSNKERYAFFKRTVPSDTFQAMAIIQILSRFEWSYVSAVYDDSTYGSELFGEVEKLAAKHDICFAVTRKIRRYPTSHTDDLYLEMEDVIQDLTSQKKSRVVVVISNYNQARKLFEAANRNKEASGLIWIGSDGWSGRESVVKGLEHIARNAITVQPLGKKLKGFDQYFTSLTPTSNSRNPWFREFWASHFHCHWPDMANGLSAKYPAQCNENSLLDERNGYRQLLALTYVRNAVQVYAHALKNMHADKCGNTQGLCPAMDVSEITGEDLLAHMENVTFTGSNGQDFAFVNKVDGPPRYSLLSYRFQRGQHMWIEIGNYTYENGQEKIMPTDLFRLVRHEYPTSMCSQECAGNEAKKVSDQDKCCWVCVNCTSYQYLPTESECRDCPMGHKPNSVFNACVPIPEVFMAHGQGLSVGLSAFSLAGMIVCFIIGIVFYRYRHTPVIKASGTELSFVLLAGVALSYASTFAFVAEPRPVACGFTRFLFGLSYTVCYAAILIKTNRIARIFHGGENGAVKTKFITPRSQLLFLLSLTSVQLIILVAWIVLRLPDIDHLYPTRADNIRVCAQSSDASYLIGLIYPFLLVVLCTFYAVKTRKTPDGFNEARFIAFCAYSACILWLSFVPIYFTNSDHALRVATLSLSLSVNGTVILVCLFLPKVYIVLLRPYKNTREAVMARSVTAKSSDDHSNSRRAHSEDQKSIKSSGPTTKPEDINISVISGSVVEDTPKRNEHEKDYRVENPSTDSGCYVNSAFRESTVYVYDNPDHTEVDVGTCGADIEDNAAHNKSEQHEDITGAEVNSMPPTS